MRAKYFLMTIFQSITFSMVLLSLTLVWDISLSVAPTSGTNSPGFFTADLFPELWLFENLGYPSTLDFRATE